MAKVQVFNMTYGPVVISSSGTIVKARSTAEADDSDPALTAAVEKGRVVIKSARQEPKAEEPKAEAKPEEPKQEEAQPSEAPAEDEEQAPQAEEEAGETEGEQPEEPEENKSKRPSRSKVAKEN